MEVNRRDFIRAGALGALALGVRRTSAAAAEGMFVSLNSSMTRSMPWPEFARLAARVGYGGADVSLDAAMKDGAAATRALLSSLAIRPGAINLPVRFRDDEKAFHEDLGRLDAAARFTADIGCPRMVTVLPPASETPKPEFRNLMKDRITGIADVLARSNVRLGLEFLGPLQFRMRLPHEFIWRMPEAVDFAKECGANVGVLLDAWHWHHSGASGADIVAAGKSRIVHIHVSDAKAQPPEDVRDNQRLMPGEGVIDLTTFFQSLRKIGYTDAVSPEPIGRVPQDMSAEDGARLGLETTVKVMRKAGIEI